MKKNEAAGGNRTADSSLYVNSISSTSGLQANRSRFIIEVTSFERDLQRIFTVSGAVARTLCHLKEMDNKGLTRSEALKLWGILSLTQHVYELRHEQGLEIDCEKVSYAGRDGCTKFGRYHLLSRISIRTLSAGSAQ